MTTGTLISVIAAAVLLIALTIIFVMALRTVKKDKEELVIILKN